jgi:small subunit ribosomal protein S6
MPAAAPLYDLVLLLDPSADDGRRAEILRSVEAAIAKDGEVVNKQDWGPRSLAFQIRHRGDADYHLVQFHGTPALLEQLERTLRITDEVMRFRVIKLAPGTPAPPEQRAEPRPSAPGDDAPTPAPAPVADGGAEDPGDQPAEEPAEEPVGVAAGEPAEAATAAEDA